MSQHVRCDAPGCHRLVTQEAYDELRQSAPFTYWLALTVREPIETRRFQFCSWPCLQWYVNKELEARRRTDEELNLRSRG